VGEGGHVVQRGGDFRPAPVAVVHHAGRPVGVGGAGADRAGDFLGKGPGAGAVGAGGVKVVKRGCLAAKARNGGRETGLVGGVVGGHQDVGFRQVLGMDEGVRAPDAGLDPGAIFGRLAVSADRPGRGL